MNSAPRQHPQCLSMNPPRPTSDAAGSQAVDPVTVSEICGEHGFILVDSDYFLTLSELTSNEDIDSTNHECSTASPSPHEESSVLAQYNAESESYENIDNPVAYSNAPVELFAPSQQAINPEGSNAVTPATHYDTDALPTNNTRLSASCSLTEPTDDPIVDQAIENLRQSNIDFWLGNPDKMFKNCNWVHVQYTNRSILRWKEGAPDSVTGIPSVAVVSFIGKVSTNGPFLKPDAGWQLRWGENQLYRHHRALCVIKPGGASDVPASWWQTQWEGANRIVENGRKLSNGRRGALGYCFMDRSFEALRIRAPLFLRIRDSSYEPEDCTPPSHRYSTWEIPSQETRDSFSHVIRQGFEPQILDAYNQCDELIHPNDVQEKLDGAVVLVSCSLERAYTSRPWDNGRMTNPEWQLYANLIEVSVLKPPMSSTSDEPSSVAMTNGVLSGDVPAGN